MDKFLILSLTILVSFAGLYLVFPETISALIVISLPIILCLAVFRHYAEDKQFVTKVFLAALVARLAFGVFVHVFDLRDFFGGDANTYDFRAAVLLGYDVSRNPLVLQYLERGEAGWGITYLVAGIYVITGRNIYAAQSFCAVFGAAIAPMLYFCTSRVFQNRGVARTAAILAAVFPAFIIWTGQLLKDGLVIFLLVLAVTMALALQERLKISAVIILILSLAGVLSLRFYIFYMVGVAIVGSFLVGTSNSFRSVLRRTGVIVILGLGLTYLGVINDATLDVERYSDLGRVQQTRRALAITAHTGFGEDIDVSTTEGAISVIPIGLAYLMLAPFPWSAANLRQAITIPEIFAWWAMLPFMFWGVWWSIKNHLRKALPILIFTLMLTIVYSVFQGNVGTAYRQRTQIQVFLFMFVAVGWQLNKERRTDKNLRKMGRPGRKVMDTGMLPL